jgi:hypothetical protein
MLLDEPLDGAGKRLSGLLRTLVSEELGLSEENFPNPWRSMLSATVSTAIGGFIPMVARVAPLARFAAAACFRPLHAKRK